MAQCAACSAENPAQAHFCMACGAPLERRCPACGATATAGARFCIECGENLEGASGTRPAAAGGGQGPLDGRADGHAETVAGEPQGLDERRTVTVLFADLSGYTEVAEKLDPESVKRVLDQILERLGAEVDRHGGYVDKFIGDNVMAIFGAPVAHGDDTERAVRAGLEMQAAMGDINEPLGRQHGVRFELCVGMNT